MAIKIVINAEHLESVETKEILITANKLLENFISNNREMYEESISKGFQAYVDVSSTHSPIFFRPQ